jgi:hypothetical protein
VTTFPKPGDPRPASYASESRARRYVESLTRTGPRSGPLYLTVNPVLRNNPKIWPVLLRTVRGLMPGIEFRLWSQIATKAGETTTERIGYVVGQHRGCVLIGARHYGMLRIGPVAHAESTAFAAAGKPVFVFTGARLIAWPDCQVIKIPAGKRPDARTAAYVLLPARPPATLPTLAASFHALGIRDRGVIRRATGFRPIRRKPRTIR